MRTPNLNRRERGFTLAEIMVALAIFAIIFVATLAIYDQSNKDFKGGVERADLQQNVRVAYEKLVADIRQAGFDYDRDGFPSGAGGAAWQKSKAYDVGNVVSPLTANGFTYTAIQAGTSAATQPVWNTTIGGTTMDGTVRWRTEAGINQYQQPDEQIEFAHQRALTIRSNLDFESASADGNGREKTLETPQFPVITTGNDEIVTYALRSVNGSNPNAIEFYADFPDRRTHPGGRAENLVRIPGVDLCTTGTCTSPPYTLYRFTFEADGDLVEAPIATNIRDIEFSYYNDTTGVATAFTFNPALANTAGSSGGGQFNPNLATAGAEARARRAEIKSIRVKLTGMNAAEDKRYQNPEEAVGSPAKNFRTYTLQSLVVPRNLGKMGVRELQDAPPGEPALVSVCAGWCGGVKISWQAPPVTGETGDVDQYIVIYDTVRPPVRFQKQVGPVTSAFVDDLDPTLKYYFTVAAVNSFGTTTAKDTAGNVEFLPTGPQGLDVRNTTTPEPPAGLVASGGISGSPDAQENKITLTWANPINNITGQNAASCVLMTGGTQTQAPQPVAFGEMYRYEVLRSKNANFDPDDPAQYELVTHDLPNSLVVAPSSSTFEDNTAVACTTYYYRVRLVERCHPATSANNNNPARPYSDYFPPEGTPAIEGYAIAANPPATPFALTTALTPAPESSCGVNCDIYLQWPKVTTDAVGRTVAVEDYVITRKQMKGTTLVDEDQFLVQDSTPLTGQYYTSGTNDDPYYRDTGAHLPSVDTADGQEFHYVYTVRAQFACDPVLESDESPELKFPCEYTGGTVDIDAVGVVEGDGASLATAWQTDASDTSELQVDGGPDVDSVQVLLASVSSSTVLNLGIRTAEPYNFPINGTDAGELYRIYVIVKDLNGCQSIEVRYLEEGTPSGCCLASVQDDPLVMQYTQNTNVVDILLRNMCDNPLDVQANGLRIVWNPALTPLTTKLASITYPATAGGTVTIVVNNSNGLPAPISLPVAARDPIPAGATFRVQLQFDKILTNPISPVSMVCVGYQRPGIDLANETCEVFSEATDTDATDCL